MKSFWDKFLGRHLPVCPLLYLIKLLIVDLNHSRFLVSAMAFKDWKVIFPLLLVSLAQLAVAAPQANDTTTLSSTPTTFVTSPQTSAQVSTTFAAPSATASLTGACVGQCTIYPYTCGLRATCEVFNPNTPASTLGKQF